ncbi:RNA methyltransferase [Kutzneria sp. 744]|uniref:TrmH family RNA methyltransferase n=1 Tax=Kutzneria sp. (strain 744) TaxID=345341 RepID=UPI0003EEC73E|nr:RNA methyltransferase [Kutzneria sp. 744]EWM13119.1 TrmH family RNA methyltransferase [Kutzneria sp. 744]
MPAVITSLKDDHLQQVRALANRTGRAEAGGCLLEGAVLITQAVEAGAALRFVLAAEGAADPVTSLLAEAHVPVMVVKESVLRQAVRLNRAVSWLAVAELAAVAGDDQPYGDFAVVLDNVLDPGNLGTIVRTAVGLGVADIVCTDPETDLTSRRVLDASRAAVLRARLRRYDTPVQAVRDLRERGFEVVATSGRADTLQGSVPLSGRPVALIVGNETDGVGDDVLELADHVVRIPMSGDVESLNVGVATGISLYELRTRMALAMLGPVVGELVGAVSDLREPGYVGEDAAERALAGFSEAERAQFGDFLRRMRENLRRKG